jgi:hypothetical protein
MMKDSDKRLSLQASRSLARRTISAHLAEAGVSETSDWQASDRSKVLVQLIVEIAARLAKDCEESEISDLFLGLSDAVETGVLSADAHAILAGSRPGRPIAGEHDRHRIDPYTAVLACWQDRRIRRVSSRT